MQLKYIKTTVIILSIVCIITTIFGVLFFESINHIDNLILNYVRCNFTSSIITNVMKFISWLISPVPIILFILAMLIFMKNKNPAVFITINIVAAGTINFILKNIFRRERPFDYMLTYVKGYSFPSAHAMISSSLLCSLIYCNNKYTKNKAIKNVIDIVLLLLIILVPISRVYLGVHNLTDVLIGSLTGGTLFALSIYVIKIKEMKEEDLNESFNNRSI